MSAKIDKKIIEEMLAHAKEYDEREQAQSERKFKATDAAVRKQFAKEFKRWPKALEAAGVPQDTSEIEPVLRRIEKSGLRKLSDKDINTLFAYGLKLREALLAVGLDSPEAFARVEMPSDRWHSGALGVIQFWPYEVKNK